MNSKQLKPALVAWIFIMLSACGGGSSISDSPNSSQNLTSIPLTTQTSTPFTTQTSTPFTTQTSTPLTTQTSTPLTTQTRTPFSTVIQDIEPTGAAQSETFSRYFYPFVTGNTWVYARTANGSASASTLSLTVRAANATDATIESGSIGTAPDSRTYRKTQRGIYETNPFPFAPRSTKVLIGDLLTWPTVFYAPGTVYKSVRQGKWDEDLDNDGTVESFRLESSFTLIGTESISLPNGIDAAVRIRTTSSITLSPSSVNNTPYTITEAEDSWWVPNIGMVRSDTVTTDTEGLRTTESLSIVSGVIDGAALFQPSPADGILIKLALIHNATVFDKTRNHYYASIPSNAASNGNSIAIIHPETGSVTYSNPIGSEPFAMGLAPDGSALYVGLNGSGEVLKLGLPGMQVISRTRLPNQNFYGQLLAESIAVSPTNSDVFAVSAKASGISPRHAGVFLINGGVLQPKSTQSHTGSNLIVFNPNGQYLYGYNTETTEFGLRKIQILVDGLLEIKVVNTNNNFGVNTLDISPQGIVLGSQVYQLTDLGLNGDVGLLGLHCRPNTSGSRLICLSHGISTGEGRLALIDTSTFSRLSNPVFARPYYDVSRPQFLLGAPGQVAFSLGSNYSGTSASELWLFSSVALQ